MRNLQDISIELRADRVLCHVEVDEIPAFGYKTYHLVREEKFDYVPGTLVPEANVMENEFLRVKFNSDGTLDMTHKEAGHTYTGLHYLEDTGETGHSWIHMEPEQNKTITSHGFPCSIAMEEAGPLLARFRVDYRMQIPVSVVDEPGVDFREGELNNTSRTEETREMIITSRFTLRAGQKRVEVTTSFENSCKHHQSAGDLPHSSRLRPYRFRSLFRCNPARHPRQRRQRLLRSYQSRNTRCIALST